MLKQTQSLNDENFLVRQHWRIVEKYKDPHQWNTLGELDIKSLVDKIAPLVIETGEDELAKRFDGICYGIQLGLLSKGEVSDYLMNNVKEIAGQLSKKGSVPAVGNKMTLIQELQGMDYWKDITVLKSEQLRLDIRSLVRFIEKSEGRIVYTDFEDEFAGNIQEHQLLYGANNLEAYKKRVTQFIQSQQHHLTIYKLCMNIPITISEIDVLEKMLFAQGDVGSREQIEMAYGKQPLGKFIRSIVGLDVEAAKTAFGSFVNSPNLNPQQIRFVDTIIQYLTVNGTIDGEAFFEPPFTDISSNGLVDVFNPELSASIISLVEVVNRNAVVA